MGGLATSVLGRGRGVTDVDLFVRGSRRRGHPAALEMSGFETMVVSPNWLAKGFKNGVLVDVISRSTHDITLTDESWSAASMSTSTGGAFRALPPRSDRDESGGDDRGHLRYWYDALSLLGRPDLDWDYLARRAKQHGAKRLTAFLFFAASMDLLVPDEIVEELLDAVRPVASRTGD